MGYVFTVTMKFLKQKKKRIYLDYAAATSIQTRQGWKGWLFLNINIISRRLLDKGPR